MNSPHLPSPHAPVSESIVIDLDPVPVWVLQVHLFDLVGVVLEQGSRRHEHHRNAVIVRKLLHLGGCRLIVRDQVWKFAGVVGQYFHQHALLDAVNARRVDEDARAGLLDNSKVIRGPRRSDDGSRTCHVFTNLQGRARKKGRPHCESDVKSCDVFGDVFIWNATCECNMLCDTERLCQGSQSSPIRSVANDDGHDVDPIVAKRRDGLQHQIQALPWREVTGKPQDEMLGRDAESATGLPLVHRAKQTGVHAIWDDDDLVLRDAMGPDKSSLDCR